MIRSDEAQKSVHLLAYYLLLLLHIISPPSPILLHLPLAAESLLRIQFDSYHVLLRTTRYHAVD